MLMQWLLTVFIVPSFTALPAIYAKEVFHGGPEVLGWLLGSVGLGGIFGGLFTASLNRFDRRGVLQIVCFTILAVCMVGFALTSSLEIALAFLVIAGFVELIYLSTNQTLIQLSIPNELRGRATSVQSLGMLLTPMGAMFGGVVSDIWGVQMATILMCGAAGVIMLFIAAFVPMVRNYRLSEATAARPEAAGG
jgi:predicted MFS family arabinose efflux permease